VFGASLLGGWLSGLRVPAGEYSAADVGWDCRGLGVVLLGSVQVCRMRSLPAPQKCVVHFSITVDSPQIGHPSTGQVLRVTAFFGDGPSVIQSEAVLIYDKILKRRDCLDPENV
jgi:hypothetical protein